MAKYGEKAQEEVAKAMRKYKRGGKRITSRKQAIAVGLVKARARGAKVPPVPKDDFFRRG